jgi:hypothetical protein
MLFPTFQLWRQRLGAARVVNETDLPNFKRLQAVVRRINIATLILLGAWIVFGAALFVWSLWYVGIDAPSQFQPTPLYHAFGDFVGMIGWLLFVSFILTGILHAVLVIRYGRVMTKWQRIRGIILTILTVMIITYSALRFIIALVMATIK